MDSVVDVIIPVFRGLRETQCCIKSVLESRCKMPFELIVINDASPEADLSEWLNQFAQNNCFTLLENSRNLGFIATVNMGMTLHPKRDVVLLNSDTEVANDWLDRLSAAATRDQLTASITPFSNNATICSYPRFAVNNSMPLGWDTASLDKVFAIANAEENVRIPTAVGFCMYIRRACLDQIGLFDAKRFGRGYGEENEWCMRATEAGWQHVLAADCFVRHVGGVSFSDMRSAFQRTATEVLYKLYPNYERDIIQFIRTDPIKPYRLRADLARLAMSNRPVVLNISHALGGGTSRHIQDLCRTVSNEVEVLVLEPARDGEGRVRLFRPDQNEGLDFSFDPGRELGQLKRVLQNIGVSRVHFHHIVGLPENVRELPNLLNIPYDITIHDFYFYCPQKHLHNIKHQYCGEPDEAGCDRCLASRPTAGKLSIRDWREKFCTFLKNAERVLTPSLTVYNRMCRHFPEVNYYLAPHPEPHRTCDVLPCAPELREGETLRILTIGALGEIKGADVLEETAVLAHEHSSPLSFTLLGFGYRPLRTYPRSNLVVTGPYDDDSLPGWLDRIRPHVVWFPAQVPETYSFTLSACFDLGLPVVVTDLGALSERVRGREWSWVYPWQYTAKQWLLSFEKIREQNFLLNTPPHRVSGFVPKADFDYKNDYSIIIKKMNKANCEMVEWKGLQEELEKASRPPSEWHIYTRSLIFSMALRMHNVAWLRGTIRKMPLGIQNRLKHWLLRT